MNISWEIKAASA